MCGAARASPLRIFIPEHFVEIQPSRYGVSASIEHKDMATIWALMAWSIFLGYCKL